MATRDKSNEKLAAVFLAAIVLASVFGSAPATAETVSGGNVSSSEVPTETGTYLPNATIDGTTDSTIEVGYNAEDLIADGKVSQSDLTVELRIGTFRTTKSVANQKGVVSLTVPADELKGGSYRASAELTNGKTYPDKESWGRSTAIVTEQTSVTISGFTLTESTINASGNVGAEVTLSNPDSSSDTIELGVYQKSSSYDGSMYLTYPDSGVPLEQVTVGAGNTRTVTLTRSFDRVGTKDVAVNTQSSEQLTVENPLAVESYSLSSKDVDVGESFTVSATVKNPTSNQVSATVPAYRKTPWSDAEKSRLYLKNRDSATVTLSAGNSKTVTFQHSFDYDGEKTITFGDRPYSTVTVNDPLEYSLDGISKRVVQPGETVTISQTITNPTNQEIPYNLFIGGDRLSGKIAGGATETKQATVSFSSEQEGRQRIWIAGSDVSREVIVTSDTSIEDASSFEISNVRNITAVANEDVTLFAKVENVGDRTGTKAVPFAVDGARVGSDLAYAKPDGSEWVFVRTTAPSTPGTYDVSIGGETATLTVREPVVESINVEHVGGTTPDELPTVDASLTSWGSVDISVRNRTGGLGLTSLGIDRTTELRVTTVVENYEPRTVVSSGRSLDWRTDPVDGTDKTKVTVTLKPSELNFMRGAPRIENWDTLSDEEDRATFGIETAVLLRIDDAKGESFIETDANNLKGLSISTDAQRFRAPEYHQGTASEPPRLEIPLAAPHLTVDGRTNDGYYEAFLPNALLDEWGVDSKDDLTAAYSGGEDTQFTVTETSEGMTISLDLHYSSGTVTISPKEDSDGGGFYQPGGDGSESDSSPDRTSTTTVTTTSTTTVQTTAEATTTTEETATATTEITATETTERTEVTTESDGGIPGFGAGVALVAVVAAVLLPLRRDT